MTYPMPRCETFAFHARTSPYALVIGVYNEGEKFTRQLEALQPYRKMLDIIIADADSTDGASSRETLEHRVCALLVNKDERRGLSVQYRMALAYALSQGYEGIIMMDGNGKDGVEALPLFIAKLKEGYDFIQGSRFMPGGHHKNTPIDRVIGIRFVFNPIMRLFCGFAYTDAMNGYKACSRTFLLDPHVQPFRDVFVRYSLQYYFNYRAAKLKIRIAEVPVSRVYTIDKAPHSKIVGLRARLKILCELFNTVMGCYNPP